MRLPSPRLREKHRRPPSPTARPQVEPLESRNLLAVGAGPALSFFGSTDPADTLDAAAVLGDLSTVPSLRVDAAIGDSPAGAADVDWYTFTLDRPATVTLAAVGDAGIQSPVLGLYVRDPFDPADPATVFGARQLAQAEGTDPTAGTLLTRSLSAGSYYLAASGAGNSLFNPFLTGSGYDGQTGNYHLTLAAADLGLDPADGPAVLASNPAPDSTLDRSPTVFRLDLSAPIDPTTVLPDDDVWLTSNPAGTFGDGNDQDVPLDSVHFSDATTELQLTPAAPLAPGYYRLQFAGDMGANADVVTGPDGTPLGADALHPSGQDFALTFRVAGVEGNTAAGAAADDTPAEAHDLGDVSDGRLVQAAGAIGDDPTDPVPFDPSDVDLYHFHITGPGRYAFAAEVFAGRIDSPLNAAASLFVLGPDGHLHLVTGNDDTQNPAQASDHKSLPLFADPALFAGLTAGDYYVAVSGRRNVPDPNRGLVAGAGGIFDPEVSHSGSAGRSTGDYVLNLRVTPDDVPPQVVAVTPRAGDSLDAPPAYLTVQFDEPVNLQQLAFQAYRRSQQGILTSVYVQGADGTPYYPRLQSFDPSTGQATFLMLDRLPPGAYDLHLSGRQGLADLAGNPLVGNNPSGDYVAHFTVGGTGLPPYTGHAADDPSLPQDLGILFPHDLEGGGLTISPAAGNLAGACSAGYQFDVLQAQNYFFFLGGASQTGGVRLTLTDGSGAAVVATVQADGVSLKSFLKPGTYVVRLSGTAPANGAYSLRVVLGGSSENPQPLTLGPAPVLRLKLAPAPPPVATPPVEVPPVEVPPAPVPSVPPVATPPATTPPATAPSSPVKTPPASVPADGGTPATTPPAVVPPGVTTAPAGPVEGPRVPMPTTGAPLEAASGQLVALGDGPVGGAGAGTGGDRARSPYLALGVPDGTATGDATPLGPKALGRTSGTQVADARASLTAADRAAISAAMADFLRLFGFRNGLEMLLDDPSAPSGGDQDGPKKPEEVIPSEEEETAHPNATPAAAPVAAACVMALTGAARALAEGRRKATPATGLHPAP